jgi:putative oxidoreductase
MRPLAAHKRQSIRPHGVARVPFALQQPTARPAARLFAPAAVTDKLILQRVIKSRSFRPPVSGEGASEGKHHRGGTAMTEATSHHYIPALGNIYSAVDEYAEPILRIALGAILIPHGMQKLFGAFGGMGFAGNAALFDRIGFTPGVFWGTLVGCTELIGGILLVLGLFTRFAAAAVVIFMIMGVKFTSAKGFFWTQGGSEYALLIGFCALFFLIRGGGAWSLDRAIGREL